MSSATHGSVKKPSGAQEEAPQPKRSSMKKASPPSLLWNPGPKNVPTHEGTDGMWAVKKTTVKVKTWEDPQWERQKEEAKAERNKPASQTLQELLDNLNDERDRRDRTRRTRKRSRSAPRTREQGQAEQQSS